MDTLLAFRINSLFYDFFDQSKFNALYNSYYFLKGGRLFKKFKRKTAVDNVGETGWSPLPKNRTYKATKNKSFYGPYEYVRLLPHQPSIKPDSSSNRRESREIYNAPEFKSELFLTPLQSLPSAKHVDYFSNLFQEDKNTSINQEWSPITHWTLQEYHPHSFSYHYHNTKYPERKLQFSSFGHIIYSFCSYFHCSVVIYCIRRVGQFHCLFTIIYFATLTMKSNK